MKLNPQKLEVCRVLKRNYCIDIQNYFMHKNDEREPDNFV